MDADLAPPSRAVYRPLVVASLGWGLIAVPIGGAAYFSWAFSGYCDDNQTCGAQQPTWQLVAILALITTLWIAAVLSTISIRVDGVSNRAKVIGTLVTVVCFHGVVWLALLDPRGAAHYAPLLVILLGAPVLSALAGGYTVRQVGDRQR